MTFFLVLVIFGTVVDPRGPKAIAPLAIGLIITMDILTGGRITGAAMNPARPSDRRSSSRISRTGGSTGWGRSSAA